jgi:hypothetical protein
MSPATLAVLLAMHPAASQNLPIERLQPGPIGFTGLPAPQPAAPAPSAPSDEEALKAANVGTTGPALLDFFRKRTAPAPGRERLAELTRQLGDKDRGARDRAAGELVAWGEKAVPALRQAANNTDEAEGAERARRCLQLVEGAAGAGLVQGAARRLAAHRPAGAAEALLAYLPFADDRAVPDIENALAAVGLRGGKPDPALVKALNDPVPARRGAAAEVLCRVGGTAAYAAVRPLLQDARPTVRLRAALGLVGVHDAEAVPILIELLADLPPAPRKQAEAYLTTLAGGWAVAGPSGDDALSRRLRRDIWSAWWRQTSGERLLEEFRAHTLTDAERDEARGLIQKLDDVSADVREQAAAELIGRGPRIAPLLRQTVKQGPARVAAVAGKCLEAIEKERPSRLAAAAPRLLALRRPPGTVEALLAYLPDAEDDALAAQVVDLLGSVGCPEGRPDAALVRALEDKDGARRAAAAVALCKAGGPEQLPAVRKRLRDADAQVRMRVALALAGRRDKEAVPVLIALLADLPLEQAWQVEDFLGRIAGDKAPSAALTAAPADRARCRQAWADWWEANGRGIDLARVDLENQERGLLVVESHDPRRGNGRVLVLDRAGKVRREFDNLQGPWDAQLEPNGNLLVVERNLQRVSEREPTGKVLWQRTYPGAFACQRLRNGNLFVVCQQQLLEVDRDGKVLFTHPYNMGSILAARKFRDGQIAYVTYTGGYVRLDANGKQVKVLQLPFVNFNLAGGEVLPGDRVLVAVHNFNKVVEYDQDGRPAWEAAVTLPGSPHRLRNGHTVVPSSSYTRITRLDPAGKVVTEMTDLPYRPFVIRER